MCYTVCMWENEGWPVFKVLEKQDAYDQKSLKKISEQVKFGAKPQVSIINWDRWVYTFVLSSFHCCYFHHQYCCFLLLLVSILIFIHLIFFIFSASIVSPFTVQFTIVTVPIRFNSPLATFNFVSSSKSARQLPNATERMTPYTLCLHHNLLRNSFREQILDHQSRWHWPKHVHQG